MAGRKLRKSISKEEISPADRRWRNSRSEARWPPMGELAGKDSPKLWRCAGHPKCRSRAAYAHQSITGSKTRSRELRWSRVREPQKRVHFGAGGNPWRDEAGRLNSYGC